MPRRPESSKGSLTSFTVKKKKKRKKKKEKHIHVHMHTLAFCI